MSDWLDLHRGTAPLIIAIPHSGSELAEVSPAFVSPWLARRDADWYIDALYDFAAGLGASVIRTQISRSVIDVNRDPSGASLYPGQATTELCPTTTFDGEGLYGETGPAALGPDEREIARRRGRWFSPYHSALAEEIERLRSLHPAVVLYDAHSIRSRIPRLFEGILPVFNIGTNGGASCHAGLAAEVARLCAASGHSTVSDGRFRGGWTTRHYGAPHKGVHAIQMELAMRAYLDEPERPEPTNWPPAYSDERAAPLRAILYEICAACLSFVASR